MFNIRKLFTAAVRVATNVTRSARQKMADHETRKAMPKTMPRKRGDACIRVGVRGTGSIYRPHQGKRETLRRRIGGFATIQRERKARELEAMIANGVF